MKRLTCPKSRWRNTGLFFKKMMEVCRFFKSQTIGYFSNVPTGVFEQSFGFFDHTLRNPIGFGFPGCFPNGPIQMINVYRKLPGIIASRTHFEPLLSRFDWKLPLEKFGENRR